MTENTGKYEGILEAASNYESVEESEARLTNTEKVMKNVSETSFLENLQYVPVNLLEKASNIKRQKHAYVTAEVKAHIPDIPLGRRGQSADMLLLETESGIPIYVEQSKAGLYQSNNIRDMVGQKKIVQIYNLQDIPNKHGKNDYLALGDIQSAEYEKSMELVREFKADRNKFTSQRREGEIIEIIKTARVEAALVYYQGLSVFIPKNYFNSYSAAHPFDTGFHKGDMIDFQITFLEMEAVELEKNNTVIKGERIFIKGNSRVYLEEPDSKAARLNPKNPEKGPTVIGKIVEVDPVKGVFVEIFPYWIIKLEIPSYVTEKPTKLDADQFTEVSCSIQSLKKIVKEDNYVRRVGRARFIRYVNGPARMESFDF